jgi:hypothetical protein
MLPLPCPALQVVEAVRVDSRGIDELATDGNENRLRRKYHSPYHLAAFVHDIVKGRIGAGGLRDGDPEVPLGFNEQVAREGRFVLGPCRFRERLAWIDV